jgi:hypothetical protein
MSVAQPVRRGPLSLARRRPPSPRCVRWPRPDWREVDDARQQRLLRLRLPPAQAVAPPFPDGNWGVLARVEHKIELREEPVAGPNSLFHNRFRAIKNKT